MSQNIFLFAGEKSGDLLGKYLMRSLKKQMPDCSLMGVGGEGMRSEGLDCWMPMEEFQVIGFTAVIRALPKIIKQFFRIRNSILKTNPEAVILIDYPGLNLRMADSLRKKGYEGKIIQYVSPTVWAWGKKRIPKMVRSLDLLLCTYPFEEEFWKPYPLKTQYVGSPVKERVQEYSYQKNWQKLLGISSEHEIIALFPGSRGSEVRTHLPLLLQACESLKAQYPKVLFALSYSDEKILNEMRRSLQKHAFSLRDDLVFVPQEFRFELMRDAKGAVAKSGTVTLELALHEQPTTVFYSVTGLNYWIAKYWFNLKLPFYCIVNILLGKEVFPEWIEKKATPQAIAESAALLLEETPQRIECIQNCKKISRSFGEQPASEQAARAIVNLIA